MFPIHVSDSRQQARQECEASLMHFFKAAGERLKPLSTAPIKSFEAFQQVLERLERVNYDGVDRRMGVFGDPAHCIERIKALQDEFQMDEFIGYFNQGACGRCVFWCGCPPLSWRALCRSPQQPDGSATRPNA